MYYHPFLLLILMCNLFQIWPLGIYAFLLCQTVEMYFIQLLVFFLHVIKFGFSEFRLLHAEGGTSLHRKYICICSQTYRFIYQIFKNSPYAPWHRLTSFWCSAVPRHQVRCHYALSQVLLEPPFTGYDFAMPYCPGERRRKVRVHLCPVNFLAKCFCGFVFHGLESTVFSGSFLVSPAQIFRMWDVLIS